MFRWLFILVCLLWPILAHWVAAAETNTSWHVGFAAGRPVMSYEQIISTTGSARRITTTMRLCLPGLSPQVTASRMLLDMAVYDEEPVGTLRFCQFTRSLSDQHIRVSGTFAGQSWVVHRNDGTISSVTTPDQLPVMSPVGMYERLATERPTTSELTVPVLNGNNIVFDRTRIRGLAHDMDVDKGEPIAFVLTSQLMPLPSRLVVTPVGQLVSIGMQCGDIGILLVPSPQLPELVPFHSDTTLSVAGVGAPIPEASCQRYRLPPGVVLPPNPFQTQSADVITVCATTPASSRSHIPVYPIDSYPDPALQSWVQTQCATLPPDRDQTAIAFHLQNAVRAHITNKSHQLGGLSALQTFRSRSGNCREHARLLVAALQLAGIPAHVDSGLVYQSDSNTWIGHAWVSGWCVTGPVSTRESHHTSTETTGRWIHLDAAYPGISRSQYLSCQASTDNEKSWLAILSQFHGEKIVVLD